MGRQEKISRELDREEEGDEVSEVFRKQESWKLAKLDSKKMRKD